MGATAALSALRDASEAPLVRRVVLACRVCGYDGLYPYLDLGVQPLANALLTRETVGLVEPRIPLVVQVCVQCGLSQLTHVVEPNVLFNAAYVYASGVSPAWHRHCNELLDTLALKRGQFVLDIGSNDGTLLEKAADRGARVLGIDPAGTDGYPLLRELWSADLARATALKADVIVAQNVLGHVDDVHDFAEGLHIALRDTGTAIIEVPYVPYMVANVAFDTVYHEHLSYWTLRALGTLLGAHGLRIARTAFLPAIHGGSIRIYAKQGLAHENAVDEAPVRDPTYYEQFAERVAVMRALIDAELELHEFYGLSAPAKATVLLNCIVARPVTIFDDTPAKQGCWIPGVRVPIEKPATLTDVDRLVLFAWNWAETLKLRAAALGFRGRFFVPLPHPHWDG